MKDKISKEWKKTPKGQEEEQGGTGGEERGGKKGRNRTWLSEVCPGTCLFF